MREAFDGIAATFDQSFENAVTRRLRTRLYEAIGQAVPKGSRVLDISCGTGIDLLYLAQAGYAVSGADLSPHMIAQARSKMASHAFPGTDLRNISFEHLTKEFSGPFDLLFSNFGGLNCAANLEEVAAQLSALLLPGGYFVSVVMPPLSLWNVVASLSRGKVQSIFRRLEGGIDATGFGDKTFSVHYHSLNDLIKLLSAEFDLVHASGLNVFSPPPHATTFAGRFPRMTSLLEKIDDSIAHWPVIRSMGDHYLAVFRKRAAPLHENRQ